jgi:hypothetical protein
VITVDSACIVSCISCPLHLSSYPVQPCVVCPLPILARHPVTAHAPCSMLFQPLSFSLAFAPCSFGFKILNQWCHFTLFLNAGFDAVGERCQVNCTFTACSQGLGFDAFCEVPTEGDPDIGDAPTICRGCGSIGQKCCSDTAVGAVPTMRSNVLECPVNFYMECSYLEPALILRTCSSNCQH